MTQCEFLLQEFDQEMANTRKTLERTPFAKFEWRPHPKSFTLQQLASHIASIPIWTGIIVGADSFDIAPVGAEPYKTPQAESVAHLLEMFDYSVTEARKVIVGLNDKVLNSPWTLLKSGVAQFTFTKGATLRSFIFNHTVHHRGQLTMYLRLNDIPLPALYGPSADEEK